MVLTAPSASSPSTPSPLSDLLLLLLLLMMLLACYSRIGAIALRATGPSALLACGWRCDYLLHRLLRPSAVSTRLCCTAHVESKNQRTFLRDDYPAVIYAESCWPLWLPIPVGLGVANSSCENLFPS